MNKTKTPAAAGAQITDKESKMYVMGSFVVFTRVLKYGII